MATCWNMLDSAPTCLLRRVHAPAECTTVRCVLGAEDRAARRRRRQQGIHNVFNIDLNLESWQAPWASAAVDGPHGSVPGSGLNHPGEDSHGRSGRAMDRRARGGGGHRHDGGDRGGERRSKGRKHKASRTADAQHQPVTTLESLPAVADLDLDWLTR